MKKFNEFCKGISRGRKGITGLETAIILIAFVTVASVLAYSVLSAGIFSSEKGKETVYAGLNQASSSMQVQGDVLGLTTGGALTSVQFTLASVLQDAPVDMTPPAGLDGKGSNQNVVVINYSDGNQQVSDLPWTIQRVGAGQSDTTDAMLSNNQSMVVTVTLPTSGFTAPGAYGTFTIQIVPPSGAAITITRTLPGTLDPVIDLH
jgi:archaeal flagellin FlaB